MTAARLLLDLRSRGVELLAQGDRLRWRAPEGALSREDRTALAGSKRALLELLVLEAARRSYLLTGEIADALGAAGWTQPGPLVVCSRCKTSSVWLDPQGEPAHPRCAPVGETVSR